MHISIYSSLPPLCSLILSFFPITRLCFARSFAVPILTFCVCMCSLFRCVDQTYPSRSLLNSKLGMTTIRILGGRVDASQLEGRLRQLTENAHLTVGRMESSRQ